LQIATTGNIRRLKSEKRSCLPKVDRFILSKI
jgi:hypothetical protein